MVQVRLTPEQMKALAASHEARLRHCVPWSSALPWSVELNVQGDTYRPPEVFPGVVPSDAPVDRLERGAYVDSPSGRFRYCVRRHPRGRPMMTWWGAQVGTVVFDTDVPIPALYQRREPDEAGQGPWREAPWMSITPAELMTLRPGTRLAKGKTVVVGLGLGHQLVEVSRRLNVKRVVLVELDRELVDWLLPAIAPRVRKPLEVIVGDAYRILPTLKADVALVDIFPAYGEAGPKIAALRRSCPGIKKIWGWGASEMTGLGQAD